MHRWMKPFVAPLVVLPLVLAACSGGGSDTVALRRGISANPDTIDPHRVSSQWENIVIGDMFVGLFTDGVDAAPVLGMAESYEVDDTGMVWTFKIKDAKWSDGEPVKAEDFEYAFRRILDPTLASQYAAMLFLVENAVPYYNGEVEAEKLGIHAIDDKTLEIRLEYPAPYLPGILKHYSSFPVPKHVVEKLGEDWVRPENIVVNGPYKLVEWRTKDYLRSVVNPMWEGAENLCYKEVVYFPYDDLDAIERMISRGQLDINNAFEGQRTAELKEKFPGWVRTMPALIVTYYSINNDLEKFQDVRVRNALAMAIDREFLVDKVLTAGYVPAYSFVPPGIANYDGGAEVPWKGMSQEERQAEAKKLLMEAGYGPDNPLEFNYIFRSTDDNPKVAPAIQQNWATIADWVKPSIQMQETKNLYQRLRQADFEVADGAWVADYNDPQNFLFLLDSKTGQMNYGNYNNPEFDALLNSSNNELNVEKRKVYLKQAEQLMLDEMPIMPMWFQVTKNLVDPSLTGFQDNPEDIHRSRYICRSK